MSADSPPLSLGPSTSPWKDLTTSKFPFLTASSNFLSSDMGVGHSVDHKTKTKENERGTIILDAENDDDDDDDNDDDDDEKRGEQAEENVRL